MGIIPYNYPLWFLRSLFITYILAFFLTKLKDRYLVLTIVVLIFIFANVASFLHNHVQDVIYMQFVYQFISSIIALPFFCIASFLKKKGFLSYKFKPLFLILSSFIALAFLYLTRQSGIDLRTANYGQNIIFMYLGAFSGIYLVWVLCYIIKHVIFFSYIGRYSIVVLGVHIPIIASLQEMGVNNNLTFFITMLLMPPLIYILIRIFPYFTAQKDLIIYSNNKLSFNLSKIDNI